MTTMFYLFILISFRFAITLFPSTIRTSDELPENSQLHLFLEIHQCNMSLEEVFYLKPQMRYHISLARLA